MNVIIRRPKRSEKQELYSLFETTIRQTLELEGAGSELELINELIAEQNGLIDLSLDSDGKECYFLVAECDSKIIGTICYRPCSNIIRDCADRNIEGMYEIGSVYILPELQGKGVAKLLLNAMYLTLDAKGIDEFWLDSGYDIAKKVWRNILGKPSIIMKDYWGEGIDHHIWHRMLSEVTSEFKV